MGRSLTQRGAIRDRLQQAPVHGRLPPVGRRRPGQHRDRAARPSRAEEIRRALEVAQHPVLRACRRHRDGAELRAARQPGFGGGLRRAMTSSKRKPRSITGRPRNARDGSMKARHAASSKDVAHSADWPAAASSPTRSRRAAVDPVDRGHEAGRFEHEAHARGDRAPHPSAFHHERDDVRVRPPARTAVRRGAREQQPDQRVVGCRSGRCEVRPHGGTLPPRAGPVFPQKAGIRLGGGHGSPACGTATSV